MEIIEVIAYFDVSFPPHILFFFFFRLASFVYKRIMIIALILLFFRFDIHNVKWIQMFLIKLLFLFCFVWKSVAEAKSGFYLVDD